MLAVMCNDRWALSDDQLHVGNSQQTVLDHHFLCYCATLNWITQFALLSKVLFFTYEGGAETI